MKETWQTLLQQGFENAETLLDFLQIDGASVPLSFDAHQQFVFKVPRSFAERMLKGDPHDPLLRQVLPIQEELNIVPGFTHDPLAEQQANVLPGLLHKYPSRVLLMVTGNCAINCRYCFRRTFDYAHNRISRSQWQAVFDYIAADSTIEEVIFSGGDPLLVTDRQLDFLISALEAMPHVQRLRIHSRIPIVLPERMTPALLSRLQTSRLSVILVVHANHANEIGASVVQVFSLCHQAGLRLFNQSVLLAGVNDSVEALAMLSQVLFTHHVQPYYLHLLDPVTGTGHFAVDQNQAVSLIKALRNQLSGYLVPRLCREIAGEFSKKIIA